MLESNVTHFAAPFLELFLQLVVFRPVFVRDTLHPRPSHADLLQAEVADAIKNLKGTICSCSSTLIDFSFKPVVPLTHRICAISDSKSRSSDCIQNCLLGLLNVGRGRTVWNLRDCCIDAGLCICYFQVRSLIQGCGQSLTFAINSTAHQAFHNLTDTICKVFRTFISCDGKLLLPGVEV